MYKPINVKAITDRPLSVPFIIVSTILVTILDLLTPPGVSAWIFFVIPLLIAYLGVSEKYFFPLVFILAVIMLANLYFKTRAVDLNLVIIFNRVSGILIFFILAALFRHQKRINRELFDLNLTLENRVKERTAELEASRNELDVLNKELESNVEKLNETNTELETFAYSVSHDLRAPLRHVFGNAEILENILKDKLDEQSKQHLDIVLKSSLKLSDLIEDLIFYTTISRMEMHVEAVDLNKVFYDVINFQLTNSEQKKISWHISSLPVIKGDNIMMKSVAECLISNAIKFTNQNETPNITIGSVSNSSNEVIIFVKDNGVGFEMADSDKLFSVFKKLHKQNEFEGTGLGLANVKRIIQRHNGRVWAEGSTGNGATFFFAIPN